MNETGFKKYNVLQIFIGFVIIGAILYTLDFDKTIDILKEINLGFLMMAVCAYFLNNIFMAYRLHSIIETFGKNLRFGHVFWAHMCGMIVSDITPARSGYMYSLVPLKKRGISPEAALSTISYCYVFDLILKVVFGVVAVFMLLSLIGIPSYILRVLSIGLLVVTLLIVVALAFFNMRIPYKIRGILEQRRIGSFILKVQTESAKVRGFIPMILSISVLGWILRGFEWFMIARALGIDLSILKSLLLNPLLTVLSMVPFTSAGLGIQEFGISETLSLIGVQINAGVAFALTVRIMNTSVDCIGLKGFFITELMPEKELREKYEGIPGNIDELAYNSNILAQRYWQRKRIREIIKNAHITENNVILDVGCGSGVVSNICANLAKTVVGTDISVNAVSYAKSKKIKNASFLIADAQNLPFKSSTFDVAICGEIIEHLPEPEKMVNEVTRVLKKNGRICISTPNSTSFWPLIEFLWDHFGRGRSYGETHLQIYNSSKLKEVLRDYIIYHNSTLFVLSPFIALLNSEKLLNMLKRLEAKLERFGVGAVIVLCGRKKK